MELHELEAHRRTLASEGGTLSYLDLGVGPAVLFVHGVFTNALLWRKVLAALSESRRCIAVDLPAHGQSIAAEEQDLSLTASADLLARLCEDLHLEAVDLVGNDTGGALCQIFAVRHRDLLRTLTLTNCDAHDNLPPAAFSAGKQLAREGKLAQLLQQLGGNLELARGEAGLAMGYERPERLPDEVVRAYMGPFADPERAQQVQRFVQATKVEDLLAIEEGLAELNEPTLIVWGTNDRFFEPQWAHWLAQHIPGTRKTVEVAGGKLFFVDERSEEFLAALLQFLEEHSPVDRSLSEAR